MVRKRLRDAGWISNLRSEIVDREGDEKLTYLPPAMEGYGNLKDEISTASHSRLGNPKRQDFHKYFDPRPDQQLFIGTAAATTYILGEEKKEKRSILFVLTLRGLKQDEDNYVFQEDLKPAWDDCRIRQTHNTA